MNKEDYFIKQIANKKYIGDDGAYIDGYVYSMDSFFENIHFKKEWVDKKIFSFKKLAYKSMLVNISDAIAMNAKPKYALLSVAIPKNYSKKDIKSLAKGFKKAEKRFGFKIIGGDTIENVKLDISITIVSKTKNPIFRNTLLKDDLLCYTGTLGESKRDLEKLLRGEKISKKSKFIKPRLKDKFFYEASKYINSSMDISDGLFFELERLSKQNSLGFEFFKKIDESIGISGEEYELLFSFSEKNRDKIDKIAKKHKVKLNIFAKAIDGCYKNSYENHHFKK